MTKKNQPSAPEQTPEQVKAEQELKEVATEVEEVLVRRKYGLQTFINYGQFQLTGGVRLVKQDPDVKKDGEANK